jgi:hypothetical protein
VSPNTIKAIVNKAGLDQNTTISSRVFELYSQQKSPLQVAIALGLKAEDAIRYHQEYFMLLGCIEFTRLYPRIKDDPWPFVNLVKLALDAGMDEVQVMELLKIANGFLPSVRHEYDRLEAERSSLEANMQRSERTLQEISDRISKESKTLEQYRFIYNQLKEEIENLNTRKARIKNTIDSIQSKNEMYIKIIEMIKQDIESIISNPRRLLQFALVSIFESSRKHPGKLQALYYNMPTITTNGLKLSEMGINQDAADYNTSKNLLLDEAEQFYNRLLEESISGCTISETTEDTESSIHLLQPSKLDMSKGHTRDEDQYTNSDSNEDDLITVKVE